MYDLRNDDQSSQSSSGVTRIVIGSVLILPALALWLGTLLLPSLATIQQSFTHYNLLSEPQFIGWQNYGELLTQDSVFQAALGFTGNLVYWCMAAVMVIPFLLGWSVSYWARPLRIAVRLLFAIPLALIAPTPLLLSWTTERRQALLDPLIAKGTLPLIDSLICLVVACSAGLLLWGALFHRPPQRGASVWGAGFACWLLLMSAAAAYALQSVLPSYLITNGGPGFSTVTVGLAHYQSAFRYFQFGSAAAIGTLLLFGVGGLGVMATVPMILAQIGLRVVDADESPVAERKGRSGALITLLVVGVIAFALCLYGVLPLFRVLMQGNAGTTMLAGEFSTVRLWLNTAMPALGAATIQLTVATLAAIGIGALRPLGRRSEWLLLLFGPWLFITVLPLSTQFFMARRNLMMLDTLIGSVNPILLHVPLLFLLTLFFKGSEQQYRERQSVGRNRSWFAAVILPALPLIIGAGVILWVVEMQSFYWPLLVLSSPENYSWPLALAWQQMQQANNLTEIASSIRTFQLPLSVITLAVLSILHLFYFDRLRIDTSSK